MAFWNQAAIEPVRKRNFLLYIDNAITVMVKNVTKPKFDVEESEYKLINLPLKYPTIVKWQDVTFKVVDTKQSKEATKFYNKVFGFEHYLSTSAKHLPYDKFKTFAFKLSQLDAGGGELEGWKLVNPWIKSIDFGDNDYSTDDLNEITVTVAYDWAEIGTRSQASAMSPEIREGESAPHSELAEDISNQEYNESQQNPFNEGVEPNLGESILEEEDNESNPYGTPQQP